MTIDDLLKEATKKLIQIDGIIDWQNELLSKAPPVLWFGNSKSEKPKILTVGANPSRWEFLNRSGIINWSLPLIKSFYETKYLTKKRFYHLSQYNGYSDILNFQQLRNDITDSYNNYFAKNPYNWFGTNKDGSYNAEGLLRGMNASYFDTNPKKYIVCHIDIFPFATISDFNKIQPITQRDILSNSWAKSIVDELLSFFNPEFIIVFGRTNFNYFCNYFNIVPGDGKKWKATFPNLGNAEYWTTQYGRFKVIGLSVNLGNPKGFNANGLKEFGAFL